MAIKKSTFLILLSLVMAACGTTREKQLKTVDMGYGETSQEALSYAISSVDMEEADKSGYITIYDYLEGRVPGVKVVKNGATTASVYIRGINSVNSSTEPLFVVDGIMVNDISYINPRVKRCFRFHLWCQRRQWRNPYKIEITLLSLRSISLNATESFV